MINRALLLLFIALSLSLGVYATEEIAESHNVNKRVLNQAEQLWLHHNSVVKFTGDPNWLPYESFTHEGDYIGVIAKILDNLSDHTHINFEKIPSSSWSDALDMAKKGKVDIISGDLADETIRQTHNFTFPYLERQLSIIMHKDQASFSSIYQIADKKIAIIKDYGYTWEMIKKYPKIDFIEVDNIQQGLLGVDSGKYDAFIATDLAANYHIHSLNLHHLDVVIQLPIVMKVGLAVRKDLPELLSILNKGLAQISAKEKHVLIQQWMQQHYSLGTSKKQLMLILSLAALGIFIALIWAWYSRRQKKIAQHAEKYYHELNQRFLLAAESASLGIWENTGNNGLCIFDKRMYEIHGIPEETMMFVKTWLKHIHPDDHALIADLRKQLYNEGEKQSVEIRIIRPDGEIRHVLSSAILVQGKKGEPNKIFGTTQDITEQKKSEEKIRQLSYAAEAASRTKSRFLANMSHEIRTPMNAVMGLAHLALQANPRPQVKDYLHKIQNSSSVLLGIINDVLDFSKIEAGKLQLDATSFNMKMVFDRLDSLTTVEADYKGLQRHLIIDPKIPHWLMGDPLRLSQILLNLSNNAIKFTAKGSVTISVQLKKVLDKNITLFFSVKDTGIGIQADKLSQLFEAFEQEESSTSRRFGGTGLGLSISKYLVEKMGGKLEVHSEKGKGSEFFFSLEFVKSFAPENQPIDNNSSINKVLTGDVLVVEDNLINQEVAKGLLENMGLTVSIANNGREGVEAVEKQRFALILMDIQMPEMDGLEACQLIRKQHSAKSLPIIAMTADALVEDEARSLAAGMNAHLSKPIDPDLLYRTLAHLLPCQDKDTKSNLPNIAGVNIKQGLQRMAGNSELLIRLLGQFKKEHADDVSKLRQCLKQGETEEAKKVLHTLKGVTGNLAIEKLHKAIVEIKEDISEDNLQALEALLAEAILGIRSSMTQS